ncbi:MAG: nucleotide exchange factor GrpE [Chloroflexi bacterium RBG_19FT_COMBO_62_14]|nr:MAG: nucleotide exchange factor GrpE [Chloroflexi bacterium RBG_19FT_COMBO_62_14]
MAKRKEKIDEPVEDMDGEDLPEDEEPIFSPFRDGPAPLPKEELTAAPPTEIVEVEEPEALTALLQATQRQADEYLDGWQRARAEFANYKKRSERDQQESYARAAGSILTRFLTVLDDLERALKDRSTEGEGKPWAEGIELIHHKLQALLEAEGVETIQANGERFDPNFHEALTYEDNDEVEDGNVIDVVRQGYILNDRVLRPALVRVARRTGDDNHG